MNFLTKTLPSQNDTTEVCTTSELCHRNSIAQQCVYIRNSLVPLTYVLHSDFDQIVLSSCPPTKYLTNQDGDKHALSGISVNASRELRRIPHVLAVVAQDLIAQP